jgi:serine-type D-Ala-D-Ala carboxypeptidase (penicillin-binding protein 5/6)
VSRRAASLLIAGTVLAAVLVLIVIRLVTMSIPDVAVLARVPQTVRLSGSDPRPAWPTQGQAAISVAHVGSLGTSPDAAPEPTASLAKVMTAYLILEKHPLRGHGDGFQLTVSATDAADYRADVAQGQSTAAVQAGETLTERQLLEALLIPSGDNIAQILAVYDAGSISAFVTKMNATARRLGMKGTTYTDPSGFLSSTVSTAADQLRIFTAAMRSAAFRTIVSMPEVTLPVAGTVHNYDPLLAQGYDGKTGSDSAAEGCLAFFKTERVAGRQLTVVGVVMGQGEGSDTSAILAAAGEAAERLVGSVTPALKVHTVLTAHSRVVVARSADDHQVPGRSVAALRVIGWGGIRVHLETTTENPGTTVSSGADLGEVSLASDLPLPARAAQVTRIRASGALGHPGLGWRFAHLL